ncbi:MAG: hypothetical protein K8J09_07725 [Planctomycetes bacterium]|nr:hypothetical protein [Planctomycetota bacterium]MCC7398777.1 hypothetical protein [Planctomycetota bacterium]
MCITCPRILLLLLTLPSLACGQCATQWTGSLGTFDNIVLAVAARPNGDLVAAGGFTHVGAIQTGALALWNGSTWASMGASFVPYFPIPDVQINALATTTNGDVYASGYFYLQSPLSDGIARWNGSTWLAVGSGMFPAPEALLAMPDGDLLAASDRVARWNGTAWSTLGSGFAGSIFALARLPNGEVVAGGNFTAAGGVVANNIARWNGTTWSPLGAGVGSSVNALAVLPNGDLIAGGHFDTAGVLPASRVARWDGTDWHPLGAGMSTTFPPSIYYDVESLLALPDGDLLAAGSFDVADGAIVNGITRWNGASWEPVAGGVGGGGSAFALAMTTTGRVAVGGSFSLAGGLPAGKLAWLDATCPATTTTIGTGCTGSGGQTSLYSTSLPWAGSTFSTHATGMPAPGICLAAYGTAAQTIALASLLPSPPACQLLLQPLVLDLQIPSAGVATFQLPIPDTSALAGILLLEQIIALDITATGLTAATSTNALQLTIGVF